MLFAQLVFAVLSHLVSIRAMSAFIQCAVQMNLLLNEMEKKMKDRESEEFKAVMQVFLSPSLLVSPLSSVCPVCPLSLFIVLCAASAGRGPTVQHRSNPRAIVTRGRRRAG